MARIRRKNLLDISISSIKDEAIRIAFERVSTFVSNLISHGFETIGAIKARSINLNDGGEFKAIVKTGRLDADDNIKYSVPGKVIGVIGWTQEGGGSNWEIIEDSNSDDKILFRHTVTANQSTVSIYNGDSSHSNAYKLIIFYMD